MRCLDSSSVFHFCSFCVSCCLGPSWTSWRTMAEWEASNSRSQRCFGEPRSERRVCCDTTGESSIEFGPRPGSVSPMESPTTRHRRSVDGRRERIRVGEGHLACCGHVQARRRIQPHGLDLWWRRGGMQTGINKGTVLLAKKWRSGTFRFREILLHFATMPSRFQYHSEKSLESEAVELLTMMV
ncbi:hypothetical protein GQ55_5G076100 [Panicum hallii var. hallii]|uniref:Uncharacterized protein n=1 Tax=Panicum hallii var. hallii TaxID=1504633 RepID=A0A2T7DDW7_9POAL|nr:hypothetical protein GQ55_5G076100 [Panicum hallii var. hallii]